jgi:Flp pilus assembly CpaE family ATPase
MNGLDVMAASGAAPPGEASRFSYFRLLTFAQRRYDHIVVDFPGVVEEPAEALLTRARAVYVVCTPELTSMALARRRLRQLELRGVPDAALRVVLNRSDQSKLNNAAMEELIGHTIEAALPNDYHAVQESVEAGGFVDPYTRLGGAFIDFAARIAGEAAPKREAFAAGALPEQVPS